MADDRYLPPPKGGGRWAISRHVGGRWIRLVEDSPLESEADAQAVLRALGLNAQACINTYFPHIAGKGRCPTLELLELCNTLDHTNPLFSEHKLKDTVGV